jgi:hypothetical protein
MATVRTSTLEELTKLAADFVKKQNGLWDHAAWMDFVSNVQTKGFDISRDMQSNLGSLLEAMNQFYAAAASTKSMEKAMKTVVHDSVAFVTEHRGVWSHSDWEEFVKMVNHNTVTLSEGTAGYTQYRQSLPSKNVRRPIDSNLHLLRDQRWLPRKTRKRNLWAQRYPRKRRWRKSRRQRLQISKTI